MRATAIRLTEIKKTDTPAEAASRAVVQLVRDRQRLISDNHELRKQLQAALHRIYVLEMGED